MGAPEGKQKHFDNHHAYPKSRIPRQYRSGARKVLGKWLIIKNVSIAAHRAFHGIFGNRIPEEQLEFLRKLCGRNGTLNPGVYSAYKKAFDLVFGGNTVFATMSKMLRKWDLSPETRERYAERLPMLYRILNKKICGGIKISKFKLN